MSGARNAFSSESNTGSYALSSPVGVDSVSESSPGSGAGLTSSATTASGASGASAGSATSPAGDASWMVVSATSADSTTGSDSAAGAALAVGRSAFAFALAG